MSNTKPTADQAYAGALMVLQDLQVLLSTAGTEVSVDHTELRLKLAGAYIALGDSIGYQVAAREDED